MSVSESQCQLDAENRALRELLGLDEEDEVSAEFDPNEMDLFDLLTYPLISGERLDTYVSDFLYGEIGAI